MFGRVLGRKSNGGGNASAAADNNDTTTSSYTKPTSSTNAAPTGRLTRYSDRNRNLTHTVDPVTGRVSYPNFPSPPSTVGGESSGSTVDYNNGAGSAPVSRTFSQTSAQRYKNNILQQQSGADAPQLPPLQAPSPMVDESDGRDVFADAIGSGPGAVSAPGQNGSGGAAGGRNVRALTKDMRNNRIHDDVAEGEEGEEEAAYEEEQQQQRKSAAAPAGGIAAAAAGGVAAGGAVLGKLFGGGGQQREASETQNKQTYSNNGNGLAPQRSNGSAPKSPGESSSGSSGAPTRKPVPKPEELEDEDFSDDDVPTPPAAGPGKFAAAGAVPRGPAPAPTRSAAAAPPKPKMLRKLQLNPYQRHYLIKALTLLQMASEARELEKLGELTLYGHPFSAERPRLKRIKKDLVNEYTTGDGFEAEADDPYAEADDDVVRRAEGLQEPVILRHMFHAHLHSFPGLDQAPLKYWQQRIQVFFDEMAARNFSTSMERGEISMRRFFALAGIRYLGVFFARGVGVRGEGELRGPGPGEPGTDRWGRSKQWGKGTVKRGLDKPIRPSPDLLRQIDNLFPSGQDAELWRLAGKESQRVRKDWQAFKEHVVEHEDGIEDVHRHMAINNIKNLPAHYRNAEEWARNHAAYILHTLFVASPDADSTFKVLKGIHTLFPYWGAKQLLKYANAQLMIQGILSLLLARPAGAKSLVQRVFAFVIGKEASTIEKELINPIKKAIEEDELAQMVQAYVKRGSRPEKRAIRKRTLQSGNDVLTTILIDGNHDKPSKAVQDKIFEMQRCFGLSNYRADLNAAYPEGTPAAAARTERVSSGLSGQEARNATQFALLKLLLRECLKKRDREQASAVASGSLIPTIVKDTLETVFYQAIGEIAKTADLSSRLSDLQAFLDDMIQVKKRRDDSLQAWIALAARHENSLYYLFHECAPIMQPFLDWLQLGSDYMAMSTSDPSNPANRKAKNIEVCVEELLSDPRLTDDDVNKILREIENLTQWTLWQKVYYELEIRKNFLLARRDAAPLGLGEDNISSGSFKRAVEDIDSLFEQLMKQNGARLNDGVCRNEARGTEAANFPWIFFDDIDPCAQHLMAEQDVAELRYTPKQLSFPPPTLLHTRKLLPVFRETLLSEMPNYRSRAEPKADSRRGSMFGSAASTKGASADTRSIKSKKSGFKIPFL